MLWNGVLEGSHGGVITARFIRRLTVPFVQFGGHNVEGLFFARH